MKQVNCTKVRLIEIEKDKKGWLQSRVKPAVHWRHSFLRVKGMWHVKRSSEIKTK